jgi:hypothetical protein
MERLSDHQYQYCIIDPEGDYDDLPGGVSVGSREHPPTIDEVINILQEGGNCSLNLLGLAMEDRPPFFERAMHSILDLRARRGLPHWLIVDEAHHLLPVSWRASATLPKELQGVMLITVLPEHVAEAVLGLVDVIAAIGKNPQQTISSFASCIHRPFTGLPEADLERGEALLWHVAGGEPFRIRTIPPKAERRRHLRKYAEGELPPERSFWFRGPDQRLNLRAQNLRLFLQIGDGVDDATWLHHFRRGDYSRWVREMIKDRKLAEELEYLEAREISPRDGRRLLREIIEQHATGAA